MAGLWMVRSTVVDGTDPAPLTNTFVNVFGYRSNLAVINEEFELWTAFDGYMRAGIVGVLHEDAQLFAIDVIELNGTRFYSAPVGSPAVGLRTGDKLPRFVAWKFRLNRTVRHKHHGAKRLGPISESDITDGIANAGVGTALTTFGDRYGAALYVGAIATWFPVILERPLAGDATHTWHDHASVGAEFTGVTTQNTRKR